MKYSLFRLLNNIKYLMKYDLKNKEESMFYQLCEAAEDIARYEVMDENLDPNYKRLNVLDAESTVNLLLNNPKSFARFGDGELELIKGNSIPFQKYDRKLADELAYILSNMIEDFYVGVNYNYFHSTKNFNEFNRRFYWKAVPEYRKQLLDLAVKDRVYIAAGFNQLYIGTCNLDYNAYYDKIKNLFYHKDLVIVSGQGILEKLQYDVFELANSKQYIFGPSKNAFSEIYSIYTEIIKVPKSKLIVLILGPTSKVLAYRLNLSGYIAWDIGHLAEDYNAYMNKLPKIDKNIVNFFISK